MNETIIPGTFGIPTSMDFLSVVAGNGMIIAIGMIAIAGIFFLLFKFNQDFPEIKIFARDNGIWKPGKRRLYSTMIVQANEIVQGLFFGTPIVGPPVDGFQLEQFQEGKNISSRYICRKEKNTLIPYHVTQDPDIQLLTKTVIAKELAARYINEQKKAKEFVEKKNPLMAILSSYIFAIIILFVMASLIFFLFQNFDQTVKEAVIALKEVAIIIKDARASP